MDRFEFTEHEKEELIRIFSRYLDLEKAKQTRRDEDLVTVLSTWLLTPPLSKRARTELVDPTRVIINKVLSRISKSTDNGKSIDNVEDFLESAYATNEEVSVGRLFEAVHTYARQAHKRKREEEEAPPQYFPGNEDNNNNNAAAAENDSKKQAKEKEEGGEK